MSVSGSVRSKSFLNVLYHLIYTELNVTVSALYEPAPGEVPGELGPNQFTPGSDLTLNCLVEGHSGALSYTWSLTGNPSTSGCYSCSIDISSTTSTLVVGRPTLLSYYAGNYSCTVSEIGRPASSNRDNFSLTVIGELTYNIMFLSQWTDSSCFQVQGYMR